MGRKVGILAAFAALDKTLPIGERRSLQRLRGETVGGGVAEENSSDDELSKLVNPKPSLLSAVSKSFAGK